MKRPRGLYVAVAGELRPVTGARQSEAASAKLAPGERACIDRWTGAEWVSTGLVLHGAPAGEVTS